MSKEIAANELTTCWNDEARTASVAMSPSGSGVLFVAAPRSVPLGFVRRVLDRAVDRAKRWLESGT